ncbi:hypothetical protein Pcinc_004118 [Petrolisthes cinctipes]|uniref:Uncharacterized protein n=1 Tax=Petrolisthes cinctipes TaxID=88211 RepID=A0AAE1L0L2_PETCI|nr:hypothetical protein Pcinc_004118 [Petrolisthes cinctipes]
MMMMMVMVVMVLALTPPVDAGIRTECPAYNQSSMVPQQPLEMNKIGERVLEARFQLSPPPDDNTSVKTITAPDVITKLAPQDFLQLRVGCWHLYYDIYDKMTIPLSFNRYKWEKQPSYLKKKGGECWVELSTNNDEEEKQILDNKCPYNLPEFPQLQLTVKCPDNDEQCATINFCNTG